MQIFRHRGDDAGRSLRHRLLERTFLERFGPRADNAGDHDLDEDPGTDGHDILLGLGGLVAAPDPEVAAFCGMIAAPGRMLGRNLLICFRPLSEELAALQARHPGLAGQGLHWCRDVLRAYTRCLFVDDADFKASVGFAPWCDLGRAPRFAVTFGGGQDLAAAPPVCIFLHDAAATGAAAEIRAALERRTAVTLVSRDAPPPEAQIAAGGIHIHCGFARRRPVATLSPYDSLVNGNYCYVVERLEQLDDSLQDAIRVRSYADATSDPAAIAAAVDAVLDRLHSLHAGGLRFNPETGRYTTLNRQLLEQGFSHLAAEMAA